MAEVAEQAQRRQANQQQNQEQAGSLVEQFGHSMHDGWTLTALWASIQRLSRSRCSTCQRQPIAVIVLRIALDAGRRAPRRRDERTAGQERSARRVPGGTRLATVRMITSMEVARRPVAAPEWAPLVPGVRACTPDELPAGYSHGYRFEIPAIDMPVYLAYLLARLRDAGVTVERDAVSSLEAVRGAVPAVINCTGMGARELARDPMLRPVRGQLVIAANPGVETGLVEAEDGEDSTELTFLIPHRSTLVLGGTAEPDDERWRPDPATTEAILARCARLDPRLQDLRVLAERVGFRPERHEVRVAAEESRDAGTRIWHNYGHGGAGVTLSWGCAEEITASVLAAIDRGAPTI
jgi:D-amino-acid oxidase